MKKIISLALVAVMLLTTLCVFASCGESASKSKVKVYETYDLTAEKYAFAVAKENTALKTAANELLAELKAKMIGGVTLKANDNFDGGFRIAVNNGSVYYDYSAEAVTDMLSNYLSPRVTALLKEAE